LWPHAVHRAQRRNLSLDASVPYRISIALRHPCNHLIIFQVVSPTEAEIFYDEPGNVVWENSGPMQSNGQRSISLKKIDGLRSLKSE
jgi:hypothetical protein